MMDAKYNSRIVEHGKYDFWLKNHLFSQHDPTKQPYSVILPPPNITGKLHLGHAQNGAIQDALVRFKKLNGFDVLFLPSVDHAGISAQIRVEQELAKQGILKQHLGKSDFLKEIHKWKDAHVALIRQQWAKLGLALDYTAFRYTMDERMLTLIPQVFVKMYHDKLIYRAHRPIYWDVKQQTALSNMEVLYKKTTSKMYYIKYFLKGKTEFLEVATTRPETIFSDVAVVLNRNDKRFEMYKHDTILNPLNNREMPVLQDANILEGFGTGIMKCSAHAEDDIRIIQEHGLPIIECIDKTGKMNENALAFQGLDRFVARDQIVHHLQQTGKVTKVENFVNNVGYSQRSDAVIEIMYSLQWFVKMDSLAKLVADDLASLQGVDFHPPRFKKTMQMWMNNVHDWTISRQLWWGHRIPAWYKDGAVKVQEASPGPQWQQDEDVLDTWFSSALAPFAFLGWDFRNENWNRFFPTSVLVTAYDIIFFWVARMYFQSLYLTRQKPFRQVLLHGLIRDEQGRKMSKSLNNGIDPNAVVEEFGADALRWFLLTKGSLGFDLSYSRTDLGTAWNLNNKLWNVSRFIIEIMETQTTVLTDADNWIYAKLNALIKKVNKAFANYEFTIFGKAIQDFIFIDLSSWYVEISKNMPNQLVALDVLQKLLILLHPVMPFITEDIYLRISGGKSILNTQWPQIKQVKNALYIDKAIDLVILVRNFRATEKIKASENLEVSVDFALPRKAQELITKLANVKFIPQITTHFVTLTHRHYHLKIALPQHVIRNKATIMEAKIAHLQLEIQRSEQIINNAHFVAKAPAAKVALEKAKYENYKLQLAKLLKEN